MRATLILSLTATALACSATVFSPRVPASSVSRLDNPAPLAAPQQPLSQGTEPAKPAAQQPQPQQPATGALRSAQGPHRLGARSTHLLEAASDDVNLRVTPVVKAVRRAADSVVSIYILDQRRGGTPEMQTDGQGSGVILDENGLVITNWHVVAKAAVPGSPFSVAIRLKNNRVYDAQVLSSSATDDLALLSVQLPAGVHLQPIVLGDSDSLMIGETVVAIGNPQGHANTVTVGVLSAENRSIQVVTPDRTEREYKGLLQTDAAINAGNSGGALLDITGKLIGINNAMAVNAENIGFAIPVNTVKRVFQKTLTSAENMVTNVWVGMRVVERDDGVAVTEVTPGGPADRSGVRPGDRVVRANGTRIDDVLQYTRQVLAAHPGQAFRLELSRDGHSVRALTFPLTAAGHELLHRIGAEVETVTAAQDEALVRAASLAFFSNYRRARMLRGIVRVTRVEPDGPAAHLGLTSGDILLGITYSDGWSQRDLPVVSEADLADKARAFAGGSVQVTVMRKGKVLEGSLEVRR